MIVNSKKTDPIHPEPIPRRWVWVFMFLLTFAEGRWITFSFQQRLPAETRKKGVQLRSKKETRSSFSLYNFWNKLQI